MIEISFTELIESLSLLQSKAIPGPFNPEDQYNCNYRWYFPETHCGEEMDTLGLFEPLAEVRFTSELTRMRPSYKLEVSPASGV